MPKASKGAAAPAAPLNVILVGNVTDQLRKVHDASVHCVVTSPPYWGLRSYRTKAQVWGGNLRHAHKFKDYTRMVATGAGGNWTQAENGDGLQTGRPQTRFRGSIAAARKAQTHSVTTGLCRCGAWRGNLGLEPSPAMMPATCVP